MAILPKTFTSLIQVQPPAIQGRTDKLIDFSIGAVLRAVVEANAGLALWLQAMATRVLAASRAATADGSELDTWVADFGLTRLGAASSVGSVTFSRFTPSAQALIPIGAVVRTADSLVTFLVSLDASRADYNAGLGGYVVPAGIASASVPIQAETPGATGNVLANTVVLMVTSIPFIDTVTNAAAIEGGGEAEGDEALRNRFRMFIASLSKGTADAIRYAILSMKLGMSCTIQEHEDYAGTPLRGHFCVVVDDGTGVPDDDTFDEAYARVEATRAAGLSYSVHKPVIVLANVYVALTVVTGYDRNTVLGEVATAIRAALDAWPLGETLPHSKLAQLAYEASAGVKAVTGPLLNGTTADLTATYRDIVRPNLVTVA